MEITSALQALSALAQETRWHIFRLLAEHGPGGAPAGDIARALRLPPATLSFHVKELANAGLVSARPLGRQIRYAADVVAMRDLVAYLSENCCGAAAAAGWHPEGARPFAPAAAGPIPKPSVRPKTTAA